MRLKKVFKLLWDDGENWLDKQKTAKFAFPFWFKIFLYGISLLLMATSIFFSLLKGIFDMNLDNMYSQKINSFVIN